MADIDLQTFIGEFDAELQEFHPTWDSRIAPGANQKKAKLWANGVSVILDLTEGFIEPGGPGQGSRKYDQIRMILLRESGKPFDEAAWMGQSPERLSVQCWKSVNQNVEVKLQDEAGAELTIEQVYAQVRRAFTEAVDSANN